MTSQHAPRGPLPTSCRALGLALVPVGYRSRCCRGASCESALVCLRVVSDRRPSLGRWRITACARAEHAHLFAHVVAHVGRATCPGRALPGKLLGALRVDVKSSTDVGTGIASSPSSAALGGGAGWGGGARIAAAAPSDARASDPLAGSADSGSAGASGGNTFDALAPTSAGSVPARGSGSASSSAESHHGFGPAFAWYEVGTHPSNWYRISKGDASSNWRITRCPWCFGRSGALGTSSAAPVVVMSSSVALHAEKPNTCFSGLPKSHP
jgi:hypothetical protein